MFDGLHACSSCHQQMNLDALSMDSYLQEHVMVLILWSMIVVSVDDDSCVNSNKEETKICLNGVDLYN